MHNLLDKFELKSLGSNEASSPVPPPVPKPQQQQEQQQEQQLEQPAAGVVSVARPTNSTPVLPSISATPAPASAAVVQNVQQMPAAALKSPNRFIYKSVVKTVTVGVTVKGPTGTDCNLGEKLMSCMPCCTLPW
jgi:hypothetical protein